MVMTMAATGLHAEDTFASFAALEHDGNLTTFTGRYALINALDAADDGDVITLSSGVFDLFEYGGYDYQLAKSITLRGAGIDATNGKHLTNVKSDYGLSIKFHDATKPVRDLGRNLF